MVVTKTFELRIIRNVRERTLHIGDNEHTIFIKYEICEIDENGTVIKSVNSYVNFIFASVAERISQICFISIGSKENTLQLAANRRKRIRQPSINPIPEYDQ